MYRTKTKTKTTRLCTLKYPIKEHALLLIFNILPPLLAFFHPACLLFSEKFPPCSFIPSLLDYFFLVKKYLHPALLAFVYSFLTYTWLQMQINTTNIMLLYIVSIFHKISLKFVYSKTNQDTINSWFPPCSRVYSILLFYSILESKLFL